MQPALAWLAQLLQQAGGPNGQAFAAQNANAGLFPLQLNFGAGPGGAVPAPEDDVPPLEEDEDVHDDFLD